MPFTNTLNKYWKTAAIVSSRSFQDNRLGLSAKFVLRLLRVVVLLSLWRTVFAGRDVVSGMTLDAVMTYTLIAEAFTDQMSIRTGLSDTLWQGIIANRLLRPIGIYGQFIVEMVGDWAPALMLHSLPLLVLAPMLGVDVIPESPSTVFLFLLSLVLGVAVGAALDVLYSACMVFLDQDVYALIQIRDAVSVLLSGAILPLALLPWGIGDVLTWLPFAALASAPLRIFTDTGDPVFLIGLQAMWALILWPAAHGLWCHNRERLVSHGG